MEYFTLSKLESDQPVSSFIIICNTLINLYNMTSKASPEVHKILEKLVTDMLIKKPEDPVCLDG